MKCAQCLLGVSPAFLGAVATANGRSSVKEVAASTGAGDVSYFVRAFAALYVPAPAVIGEKLTRTKRSVK